MSDQDWLRTLLEKIDQDRRESDASMFISSNPPCKLDGPRWVS